MHAGYYKFNDVKMMTVPTQQFCRCKAEYLMLHIEEGVISICK